MFHHDTIGMTIIGVAGNSEYEYLWDGETTVWQRGEDMDTCVYYEFPSRPLNVIEAQEMLEEADIEYV